MFGCNEAVNVVTGNPLRRAIAQQREEKRQAYLSFWTAKVLHQNRAWYYDVRLLHYDHILAIDEFGDHAFEGPHLLIEFDPEYGPFDPCPVKYIESDTHGEIWANPEMRLGFFPEEYRTHPLGGQALPEAESS